MRRNTLTFLMAGLMSTFAFADNAYVTLVTTAPSNVAGYSQDEQVIGQETPVFGGSIANTSKMWVLGDSDAANEVAELPRPAVRANQKTNLHRRAKGAFNPPPRVKTDCVLCEAERNLLLGKMNKKIAGPIQTQAEQK